MQSSLMSMIDDAGVLVGTVVAVGSGVGAAVVACTEVGVVRSGAFASGAAMVGAGAESEEAHPVPITITTNSRTLADNSGKNDLAVVMEPPSASWIKATRHSQPIPAHQRRKPAERGRMPQSMGWTCAARWPFEGDVGSERVMIGD